MTGKRFDWTPEKLSKLRKLAKIHTRKEAAEQLGCSVGQIWHCKEKFGICFKKTGELHHSAKHSDHDVELIRQLSDAGLKNCEIAEKMEINSSNVSRIINFKERFQDGGVSES